MKVITGKVVEGKIVLEPGVIDEGAKVTVLSHEDDESFEVSPEEEVALLAAIAEADRGETVAVEEVLLQMHRPS